MTREKLNEDMQHQIDGEKNRENIKKAIIIFIKSFFIILIFSTIFYAYTTYISTVMIQIREYRIKNEKIPNSFNSFKIIQISDLHYGSTMFLNDLDKIGKLINERKPDIILFTGDLIYKKYKLNNKEQEKIIKKLSSYQATLGKYAVFGNEDNEEISNILTHSHFNILRDEYDLIYNSDNTPILLVGLNSLKKSPDIDKAFSYFSEEQHNSNIYTIAMFHEPDLASDLVEKYDINLMLAGHSHNGNIRFPFIKYSPFKVDGAKQYDQDYYKVKNAELYISSGLGTPSGIRLFCRPTINFYRLSNN